ncbi:hypothetical protein Ddc_18931 [Ditylenchus destructor]|nr:hypothetical protein Ddc_18931 [Ditylenchus destructor]
MASRSISCRPDLIFPEAQAKGYPMTHHSPQTVWCADLGMKEKAPPRMVPKVTVVRQHKGEPGVDRQCHMYAVVNDTMDGTSGLRGDQGTTWVSTSQLNSSEPSGYSKMSAESPYLQATSVSCAGCALLKPSPTCTSSG